MPLETLRLRVASLEDAKRLFDWSAALGPQAAPLWGRPIWEEHLTWFERMIGPTDTLLFMGEAGRTDDVIGAVCFRAVAAGAWGVEIVIASEFRRRGWSAKLLRRAMAHLEPAAFVARIAGGDDHARSLFVGAGFVRVGEAEGWDVFRREAPAAA
jgi:GNAT superfamily N-acetyltransferase